MTDDIVTRLRKQHTIQYGWKLGELVKHTEHNSDPQIRDRMNRCEVCEQWSPCDGIKAADEIERLRAENQRLKEARFDLQASDFHCWVCADFLSTARRRTDIHRLKEEEKAVRGE
jgi:hypothetical protein